MLNSVVLVIVFVIVTVVVNTFGIFAVNVEVIVVAVVVVVAVIVVAVASIYSVSICKVNQSQFYIDLLLSLLCRIIDELLSDEKKFFSSARKIRIFKKLFQSKIFHNCKADCKQLNIF